MRCAAEKIGEWRKENPGLARKRHTNWRTRNPEAYAASNLASSRRNRDKRLATTAKWRDENREYTRECARDYSRRFPEKGRANAKNRRARLLGADGQFTADDIAHITKRQNGKCACCKKSRKLTVDHIQPLSKRGSNWPANLQMLCRPCNSRKGNRDPVRHMQSLGLLI